MSKRSRWVSLVGVVLIGVVTGVITWMVVSSAPEPVNVVLDATTCANPSVILDGKIWDTTDVVPWSSWRQAVPGELAFVDDDSAIFRAVAGFELRYEAVEWSHMDCLLLANSDQG